MNKCKDCGQDMGDRGKKHDYCSRCLADWYGENDLDPSETPNGDWDDDGNMHTMGEY